MIRAAAAQALGTLGSQDAVDPLVDAVHDPSDRVRLAAVRALAPAAGAALGAPPPGRPSRQFLTRWQKRLRRLSLPRTPDLMETVLLESVRRRFPGGPQQLSPGDWRVWGPRSHTPVSSQPCSEPDTQGSGGRRRKPWAGLPIPTRWWSRSSKPWRTPIPRYAVARRSCPWRKPATPGRNRTCATAAVIPTG